MGWLRRSGGMTAAEIAAAERVRPQSLTRLVASLEAEGLVRRRPGEADRREVILELTEAGRAALEDDMRQRDDWLERAMKSALSPTEQRMLQLAAQLMNRLAEATPDDTEEEGS
jgi:DNA-binding MarR family transcriptional regulator